jgi:RNA polymerase sigma-70 factor (ECF subfamily)
MSALALHGRRRAVTMRAVRKELEQALVESFPELRGVDGVASDIVTAVAAKWPLDWMDGGHFARFLVRRLDPGIDLASALTEVWVADLYLACAVIAGVPSALAAFDKILRTDLPPAIRTIDNQPDAIDEVLQLLREKLLVPSDGVLRLESYSGHGPLGGWLRVSALRIALSMRRRRQPELAADDELAAILDLAPNAEVKVLAVQVGSDLRDALRAALAAQPARIRTVLRMYYADNQGVEDIGRVYNVHASTVSRWLAKARADILAHTRAELMTRLQTSQVDSLLGHAASLEISLETLLRTQPS